MPRLPKGLRGFSPRSSSCARRYESHNDDLISHDAARYAPKAGLRFVSDASSGRPEIVAVPIDLKPRNAQDGLQQMSEPHDSIRAFAITESTVCELRTSCSCRLRRQNGKYIFDDEDTHWLCTNNVDSVECQRQRRPLKVHPLLSANHQIYNCLLYTSPSPRD